MGGAISGLFGGGQKMPKIDNSAQIEAEKEKERKRAAAAQGRRSTILTGGQGVQSSALGEKETLGQ